MQTTELVSIYARLALGTAYLSSVASRFGLWGKDMGWGNFDNFLIYTAKINPYLSDGLIPAVGWIATVAETAFAILLIAGLWTRVTATFSGIMLILFALGMAAGINVKEPLDYSVFTASAASFMLAALSRSQCSQDALFYGGSWETN